MVGRPLADLRKAVRQGTPLHLAAPPLKASSAPWPTFQRRQNAIESGNPALPVPA